MSRKPSVDVQTTTVEGDEGGAALVRLCGRAFYSEFWVLLICRHMFKKENKVHFHKPKRQGVGFSNNKKATGE